MRQWIGAAALALAACGGANDKAAETGNRSASTAGGQANAGAGGAAAAGGGGGATMQPGQWEITTAVTGLEAPNLPAGMSANAMPPPSTTRVCLTAEQVAQPATGVASGGLTSQAGCRTESNNASGGRIESVVQCEAPGGGRVRVATTGQAGATSVAFDQRTEVSAQGTNMTTRTRVTGRRIGDCPA
ncbi:MAG TPA: DUF3617 family protein [Allosphingosinicella sp.]|jgi:hypothetical protein